MKKSAPPDDVVILDGERYRIVERFPIRRIYRDPKTKLLEDEVLATGCRTEKLET